MGRGGHHHSHHHHHYHHRHYGSSSSAPLWVYVVMLIVIFGVAMLLSNAITDDIRNGERIDTTYELTGYLYDNANYFNYAEEVMVIESLEYFYENTGAQMVIVTQNEYKNDSKTEQMYYEMFGDESHVLIVLPMDGLFGTNSTQYYYMGDDALIVIDETGINHMLDNIDNSFSSKGEAWSTAIRDITDLIVEE